MEIGIGIGIGIVIGIVIALILSKRKKRNAQPHSSLGSDAERQRKLKVDDELITVILPTINHDK